MRRRLIALVTTVLLVGGLGAPLATGQTDGAGGESAVTADLSTVGTRSVASVGVLSLSGALSTSLTDNYSVAVEEVSRTGTNPWSVTGRVCGPNDFTTPTGSDCSTFPDQLAKDVDTTVPGSAISLSNMTFSDTLTVGDSGTLTAGSTGDMSAARTLGTNTDQSTTLTYTETYTLTGDMSLTPPDGTETGTYLGYFVVTLIQ